MYWYSRANAQVFCLARSSGARLSVPKCQIRARDTVKKFHALLGRGAALETDGDCATMVISSGSSCMDSSACGTTSKMFVVEGATSSDAVGTIDFRR